MRLTPLLAYFVLSILSFGLDAQARSTGDGLLFFRLEKLGKPDVVVSKLFLSDDKLSVTARPDEEYRTVFTKARAILVQPGMGVANRNFRDRGPLTAETEITINGHLLYQGDKYRYRFYVLQDGALQELRPSDQWMLRNLIVAQWQKILAFENGQVNANEAGFINFEKWERSVARLKFVLLVNDKPIGDFKQEASFAGLFQSYMEFIARYGEKVSPQSIAEAEKIRKRLSFDPESLSLSIDNTKVGLKFVWMKDNLAGYETVDAFAQSERLRDYWKTFEQHAPIL